MLAFDFIQSSSCAGTDQEDPSMFSTNKKVLRSGSNLLRKLRTMIAIKSWIVLTTVFTFCSLAPAADIPTGKPQIQGGNLRIEFDNRLRSRVVARFDKTETVLGPFTASETVTTADKLWTGFLLTSQKHEHIKDTFGEGERLLVEGKAGGLKKTVGQVELRGLADRNYSVVDCITGKSLGTVSGHSAHLPVEFDGNLLVEVRPQ